MKIINTGTAGLSALLLFSISLVYAQDTTNIKQKHTRAAPLEISLLSDPGRELNCANIATAPMNKSFRRIKDRILKLGFSTGTFWFRLRVPAKHEDLFIIFQENLLATAAHCLPNSGMRKAGTEIPFHGWPLKLRYPAFKIKTSAKTRVHYFFIQSDLIMNFPIQLLNFPQYIDFIQYRQIIQVGIMALAFLAGGFYLTLFFIGRRIPNLYFSALIVCVTISFFIVYGDAWHYYWPDSTAMQAAAAGVTTMLSGLIASLFGRHLLTSWQLPRLDRAIKAIFIFQALGVLVAPFPSMKWLYLPIMYSSPFIALSVVIPAALIQLFRGRLPAGYYLLGWTIFLVALILNVATYQGWVGYNSFLRYAPIQWAPLAFLCFAVGVYKQIESQNGETRRLQRINKHLHEQLHTPRSAPVGQTQLGGVDVHEKKAQLLQAMQSERLFEAEDLRLETLALHIDIRAHQLSELLNKELNVSFTDFVRSFRVDAAREQLQDPNNTNSILRIGLSVGFGSKSAFNRSFTSLTGLTPKQFRNQAAKAFARATNET